ncbi:MAG: hypothetical protein PHO93_02880 [Candidatus Saccharimonadaceae bacterium]|nr:hypothetical protein [Candidatus Saccharimonadaceae bacterium]
MLLSNCQRPNRQPVHTFQGFQKEIQRQLFTTIELARERWYDFSESDLTIIDETPQFTPVTPTEVPLVVLYLPDRGKKSGILRTADMYWDALRLPSGCKKVCSNQLLSKLDQLVLANGIEHKPGLNILGFDPYYHDIGADYFSNNDTDWLAHCEIIASNVMLDNWVLECDGIKRRFIEFGGYRLPSKDENYPEIIRIQCFENDDGYQLSMYSAPRDPFDCWSTPKVRKVFPVNKLAA